jgi:hypothetical protein
LGDSDHITKESTQGSKTPSLTPKLEYFWKNLKRRKEKKGEKYLS